VALETDKDVKVVVF
jgi:enoyl-CoA hydratase/carnithine racemase